MEMVGSTVVQQAGLSVMNAQKGVLPHGWLEYTDEASGRPYYYNVHTKVFSHCRARLSPPTNPICRTQLNSTQLTSSQMRPCQVTTWYKPTGAVPPPPSHVEEVMGDEEHGISLDCSLDTHSVAMSGFI